MGIQGLSLSIREVRMNCYNCAKAVEVIHPKLYVVTVKGTLHFCSRNCRDAYKGGRHEGKDLPELSLQAFLAQRQGRY